MFKLKEGEFMFDTQPRALSATYGDGDSTKRKMQIQEHLWSWTPHWAEAKDKGQESSPKPPEYLGEQPWRSQGRLKSEKATA